MLSPRNRDNLQTSLLLFIVWYGRAMNEAIWIETRTESGPSELSELPKVVFYANMGAVVESIRLGHAPGIEMY